MPTGIRPKVNEAREFLEIAKDFKDPKEILREALSNSWDAGARTVSVTFSLTYLSARKKMVVVEIVDDGEGMDEKGITFFFNLGDSNKKHGCIGTKGHGTKIFYKSAGIFVDTYTDGKKIHAETEMPPWQSLREGLIPTYKYDVSYERGRGTKSLVDKFEAKVQDFEAPEALCEYILWNTVVGSFGNYFGNPRKMDVTLKPAGMIPEIHIPFGFKFPDENTDLSGGTHKFVKHFGPETVDCGKTEDGTEVSLEIVGTILGEGKRDIVPHTYEMMGLWLCKDYIKVERANNLIEDVFKGQYYYRSMLIFANCQQFDLTANRNNVRKDEAYDLAAKAIADFIEKIEGSQETAQYFKANKKETEDDEKKQAQERKEDRRREAQEDLKRRLDSYNGRPSLNDYGLCGAPVKQPRNEAETILLLQAMISSEHRGLDFTIGEYSCYSGTDLLIEFTDKGIPTLQWAEAVFTLGKLFAWPHPPAGIHRVICWDWGRVPASPKFTDGTEAKLRKKAPGRGSLDIGSDSLDVYVLRDMLEDGKSKSPK